MPGSTIHLMFAKMVNPNGSLPYFAGSIALDAVPFPEKDQNHFRKMPDRIQRLENWAKSLPRTDFNDGMISHLYLDWRWDNCELNRFIELNGEGWFKPYRADISRISHYYSHKLGWVHDLWEELYKMPISDYGEVPLATDDMVRKFIESAYFSQLKIADEPVLFKPEQVEHFLKMAALEYPEFLGKYVYND